jgi:peroxiredoxin
MNRRWLILVISVVIGVVLGLVFFTDLVFSDLSSQVDSATNNADETSGAEVDVTAPAPKVGFPAPDFIHTDLDGEIVQLSDYRGHIILLNFWATTCAACRLEMPEFRESYEIHNADGYTVLAVEVDGIEDKARSFVEKYQLSFPVLLDTQARLQELYQIRGIPVSFFIDREGIIQFIHYGRVNKSRLNRYLVKVGLNQ